MSDKPRATYITEAGFLSGAIGGAVLAMYQGVPTLPEWVNGIGLFLSSLGGALILYRVSKKLTDK